MNEDEQPQSTHPRYLNKAGWAYELQEVDGGDITPEMHAVLVKCESEPSLVVLKPELRCVGQKLYNLDQDTCDWMHNGYTMDVCGTLREGKLARIKCLDRVCVKNCVSDFAVVLGDLQVATEEDVRRTHEYRQLCAYKEDTKQRYKHLCYKIEDMYKYKRTLLSDVCANIKSIVKEWSEADEQLHNHMNTNIDFEYLEQFGVKNVWVNPDLATLDRVSNDFKRDVLRITFAGLSMKYRSEGTRIALHSSLEGATIELPEITLVVDAHPSQLESLRDVNAGVVFDIHFECAKSAFPSHFPSEFLHPHIEVRADEASMMLMLRGNPCLGSYKASVDKLMKTFDIHGLVALVHDFLTSCSESGWYRAFTYFLPNNIKEVYCKCGKYKHYETTWSRCVNCGTYNKYSGEETDNVTVNFGSTSTTTY